MLSFYYSGFEKKSLTYKFEVTFGGLFFELKSLIFVIKYSCVFEIKNFKSWEDFWKYV